MTAEREHGQTTPHNRSGLGVYVANLPLEQLTGSTTPSHFMKARVSDLLESGQEETICETDNKALLTSSLARSAGNNLTTFNKGEDSLEPKIIAVGSSVLHGVT